MKGLTRSRHIHFLMFFLPLVPPPYMQTTATVNCTLKTLPSGIISSLFYEWKSQGLQSFWDLTLRPTLLITVLHGASDFFKTMYVCRNQQSFPLKYEVLGFASHAVFVTTTQLCHCSMKAGVDKA